MATLESEPQQKSSGWQRAVAKFGAYFEEKGLGAKDVPMAIVIHEVVGLCMAVGFWAACYSLQPSKTVGRPVAAAIANSKRGAAAQQAYNQAMASATATVQRLSWLRKASLGVWLSAGDDCRERWRSLIGQGAESVTPASLPQAPGGAERLTVSLAESLCLRATIKPITFPFKLWAAYKLTLLAKGVNGGDAQGR
ncbi:hypothetical protein ACK3TF_003447 [Chlorella vulgaris]